jgi:PhzF family phenazine biosynthesis protein
MRIRVIDAFTAQPFTGNPAAVCLVDDWPADTAMQAIADEVNVPMTAFVRGSGDERDLRWFMPGAPEQPICGHATLATAHALAEDAGGPIEVRFSTLSGVVPARTATDGTITIEFPNAPAHEIPLPDGLAQALGATPTAALRADRMRDVLAIYDDEAVVRGLAPDFPKLTAISHRDDLRGVTATAPAASAAPGYDFVSRFFSPADGIAEDPVTGSAHCALAPYWAHRLGRDGLTGLQASARGGLVGTEIHGDRVHLSGRAVTVLDAQLRQ